MNEYQDALSSIRKEVKCTYFDEKNKQRWTSDKDMDYRCNLLQELVDKETPMKPINTRIGMTGWIGDCPICNKDHIRHGNSCSRGRCRQKLSWNHIKPEDRY